jgi:hypothetical protein
VAKIVGILVATIVVTVVVAGLGDAEVVAQGLPAVAPAGAPGVAAPVAPPATPPATTPTSTVSAPASAPVSAGLADGATGRDCFEPAPCDWLGNLGSLELASVLRALSARGLVVEPLPWGRPVGRILVHNDDVFAEPGFLQVFNYFHVTSKEDVVAREVILRRGQPWDQAQAEETARRLRDPVFTSVAVILPVRGQQPDTVDVLVVTRDIWSLRFNTNYSYQDSSLTFLAVSISENNFLGRRKVLSVAYDMDQGQVGIGPLFLDKNLLGRHLEVQTRVAGLFSRERLLDEGRFVSEGSESSVAVSRPLWNLGETWGAGVSFSHRFAIERSFRGAALRSYDNPDTQEKETVPWRYDLRRWALSASAVRQYGASLKHRIGAGYAIESQRPSLVDDFVGDPDVAAAFARDVLPRSERTSLPFLSYGLLMPRYQTLRNVSTYDLAEDAQLGVTGDASIGAGLGLLGSDNTFLRASMSASYAHGFGEDGIARISASLAGRFDGGEFIDNVASGELRLISPSLARSARIVAELRYFTRWKETQNRFFTIGSDNGLRGFSIGEFVGQRKVAAQIEARSRPWRLAFFRVGGVLFYDAGGAANSLRTIELHHNAGIGLRALIPQLSRELMRFDFAFPLDGAGRGTVRFLAGFRSEF